MPRVWPGVFLSFLAVILSSLMPGVNCCHAEETEQQEMTVEDAIRIGLQNNYNIRISRNTARIAENNKGKGLANFLPTLDAAESYRYLRHEVAYMSVYIVLGMFLPIPR